MNPARLAAHAEHKARRARMGLVFALPQPLPALAAEPPAVEEFPARYRLPGLVLPPTGNARRIVAHVAAHYGATYEDLRGPSRRWGRQRQVAMVLVGRVLGYASARVAGALARADHTTALHAINAVLIRVLADPAFAAELERLEAEVLAKIKA